MEETAEVVTTEEILYSDSRNYADYTESADYALVAQAIQYLGQNFQEQPSLEVLSEMLNISPFHLQRVFSRWAGISPKRFLQFLTVDYAKARLAAAQSVLDAAYDA